MRFIHVLAAAVIAACAGPAAAAVTTVVLTGVASGSDNGHISAPSPFETVPQETDVVGATFGTVLEQAFTLKLRIDDSLGAIDTLPDGDTIYGAMTATFSLNGVAHDFTSDSIFSKAFGGPDQLAGSVTESRLRPPMDGDFTNVNGLLFFTINPATDIFQERRFDEPTQWFRGPQDEAFGHLQLSLLTTTGTAQSVAYGPLRFADLSLRFDSFSIATAVENPTAVPEPSAWALMIAGFGLVGAAARRRPARAA